MLKLLLKHFLLAKFYAMYFVTTQVHSSRVHSSGLESDEIRFRDEPTVNLEPNNLKR